VKTGDNEKLGINKRNSCLLPLEKSLYLENIKYSVFSYSTTLGREVIQVNQVNSISLKNFGLGFTWVQQNLNK